MATDFSLFVFFEPTATTDFSHFAFFIDSDKLLLQVFFKSAATTSFFISVGVQLQEDLVFGMIYTGFEHKNVDQAVETFAKQLDAGHKDSCSWRGNCCADSLVQFPPMLPSAIIGGYKDRCDGLLQFPFLPVVASSAIETMRLTRSSKIDHMFADLCIKKQFKEFWI
ncbi:hypothetical protein ZIOFF_023935 [Zingiber officinale]|uniref:C3HC-type domain-containing protein n=1 Tax=Zingiber officinale TaxID=94328 RepID=A0A8J5LIS5_ZINOF|nr:hypothetical protein ZIOFF_023935 [Zingiber officinale]